MTNNNTYVLTKRIVKMILRNSNEFYINTIPNITKLQFTLKTVREGGKKS